MGWLRQENTAGSVFFTGLRYACKLWERLPARAIAGDAGL
jgi:hypothetical protein